MRRTVTGLAAVAIALTAVGPAAADKSTKADRAAAVSACTALRTSVGAQTFAQTYGVTSARAALARCVAKMRREAHEARHAAAASCATKAKGKGKGVAKAKARCAAAAAKTELKQELDATKNAAFACKAERQGIGAEAFATRYGTNANKRNAFGKCVSQKAKENGDDDGDADDGGSQTGARLTSTLSGATGSGTFTLTVVGAQRICYTLTATGLTDITAAHIHVKPVAPGNIVVPLAAPTDGSSSGCVKVAKSLLQQMLATPSNYYVNVHTAAAPAGAIQGDLAKP